MKIKLIDKAPRNLIDSDDLPEYMGVGDVEDVAEIFHTPLTGSYNWGLYSPRQSHKKTL